MKCYNPNPKLTAAVVQNGLLRQAPMTTVDVGAAGGAFGIWRVFGDQLRVIGFEPNPEQFQKLSSSDSHRYYNTALGKIPGPMTINITRWPYSSGSYKAAREFWCRFPNNRGFDVVGQEVVQAAPLDAFRHENDIGAIDYIKVDTEGSELDILKGAEQTLSSCLAVEVEVAFFEIHEGRPLFSDIDQYLRGLGFVLYDLDTYKAARSALPALNTAWTNNANYGQLYLGDALYMRDPIHEAGSMPLTSVMTPAQLIKMICLFELFGQPDSAVELLEKAVQQGTLLSMATGLDLLVPRTFDRYLSLQKYREIFATIPEPF